MELQKRKKEEEKEKIKNIIIQWHNHENCYGKKYKKASSHSHVILLLTIWLSEGDEPVDGSPLNLLGITNSN